MFGICREDEAADAREVAQLPESLEVLKPGSNTEYINKIRKTLNEDAQARSEREKRRRKVLVDQLKAHEAQEVGRHILDSLYSELWVVALFCNTFA